MRRRTARFALILAATFAATTLLARIQTPAAELVIVSPEPDAVIRGAIKLAAEVRPPTVDVRDVTFFVDGGRVCQVQKRPFECAFDVGSSATPRDVRVVAVLADGTRLAKAVRTAASGLVFSRTIDSVLVAVHVLDRNGRFVRGLTQADFQVFEDGVAQDVESFSDETVGGEVLLALDVSGSMEPALGELRAAAAGFLRALRPSDTVTVAGFNTALSVVSPRTATPAARLAALDTLRAAGATALYDAIIQSADLVRTAASRRAVVILTDGDDVASRASPVSVRLALQTNDVVLYVIAQGKAATDRALHDQLDTLATQTGGAAFFAPKMSALHESFADIVQELSTQYVLGYSPKRPMGDGGWRALSVKMTDPKRRLQVRSREGYLAVRRGS